MAKDLDSEASHLTRINPGPCTMVSVASPPRLPDFLIIGGMRCGSTTLANLLGCQQAVFLPAAKEIHYFDRRNPDIASLAAYAEVFAAAGRDQLVGEATPDYLSTPGCELRILDALPSVKLVLILRDPVMRAWSHYRFSVYLGNENEPFERALQLEDERLAHPIPEHDVVFSYTQRGRYIDHIERFMGHFRRDRLHVLFLEDLCRDPGVVVGELLEFLDINAPDPLRGGLTATNQAPLKRIAASPDPASERRRFWHRRLVQVLSRSAQAVAPAKWRYSVGQRIEQSFVNRERLAPATASRLRAYFRSYNERLAQFIGRSPPWP